MLRNPPLPPPPTPARNPGDVPPIESGGVLDRILQDYSQADRLSAERSGFDWTGLIREIVAPYAVPGADPRQPELLRSLDKSISMTMIALLHHPAVRQLEAAWRAIDFLARRLETGASLKLFLIDVSPEELQADLLGTEDLTESGMYRLLVESTVETAGGQPWSLLAGNFYFGCSPEDISVLGRMAKIASAAGAPFITGSDGSIFGCRRPAATPDPQHWTPVGSEPWRRLRELPEAEYLALLWPRFLLRLPYGRSTRPTDYFEFEEVNHTTREHLLWGHPAFLAASAIGQDFAQTGGDTHIGRAHEVADLPVWVYGNHGESEAHPCTELLLSERGLKRVESSGVVPLVGVKDRDVVRIPELRFVGGPPWLARMRRSPCQELDYSNEGIVQVLVRKRVNGEVRRSCNEPSAR